MTAISRTTTQLYSTYKQIGQAEDVSDLISNITPFDTPFTTLIKSEKISARKHEWQEDTLDNAGSNAQYEGVDATFLALTPTTLRENNTQILAKACVISNTSDAIKTYGRAKETALQLSKKMKEIKRDLEYAFVYEAGPGKAPADADLSSDAMVDGSQRKMKSAWRQIHNDHIVPLEAALYVDTAAATSGTSLKQDTVARTYTFPTTGDTFEDEIVDLHQTLYTNGAEPDICMIHPEVANHVSAFMNAGTRRRDAGMGREVVNVVDIYISPFGTLKFVMNRHQNPSAIALLDPSMWRSLVLRPFTRTLLAPTGDHTKHHIVGEYSLKSMNYKSSGVLWNTEFTAASAVASGNVTNNFPGTRS